MKLKVTLTRRPYTNIDDFDFLTEASEDKELEKLEKEAEKATEEYRAYYRRCKDETDEKKKEELLNGIDSVYDKMIAATSEVNRFKRNMAAQSQQQNQNQDQERSKATMSQFGNSISVMFQWLMDQIANIPGWMQSIGESLRRLWGKVKGWMTKFHIVDRAKSLSMVAIACIKFVAFMVARWIYRIIFKNRDNYNNAKYNDRILQQKSTINTYWNQFKNPTAETAVFIETFGEILREDNDGGMLMAMIQRAFRSKNGKKEADIARKACLKSSNSNLRKIGGFLNNILGGTFAENTVPRRLKRRLYNETAFEFDDSLESFYDSIILEAQAHKLRSIRKKAIKKVALKNAKRSLKG